MTKTNGLFRDLAASIIANTPVEQSLFSPPDKAKHLKEFNEQIPSDADIKRQQAPHSLKAEEAFRIFRILTRLKKSKSQKSEQKKPNRRGKLSDLFDIAGDQHLAGEKKGRKGRLGC